MNSPKNGSISAASRLASWLWPLPAPVKAAGQVGKPLVLLPNARASLRNLPPKRPHSTDTLRLQVIDSGGMDAAGAAGFHTVTMDDVLQKIDHKNLPGTERPAVYIPVSLARRWKQKDGDAFGPYQVCTIPDAIDHLDENLGTFQGEKTSSPLVVSRLKCAAGYWAGQALIFALPLAIFGWQVMGIGLGILLLASLVLAAGWDLLPVPNALKGVLAGFLLAALVIFGLPQISLPLRLNVVQWGAAAWLACSWMGLVFQGLKRG